ncbi:MAG: PEP-CTERM sorting domain-containing protein [Akkermansia muciniphila]|nr:PEP-CTERM sorting domain-containing protein [Akkermansia muciniphila]
MRLHLPKALLAAVLAACLAWPAGATQALTSETTTEGSTTYSGFLVEYKGETSQLHTASFTSPTNATDNSQTLTISTATGNKTVSGYTDGEITTGGHDLFHLFCNGATTDHTIGHTLKLNSTTGDAVSVYLSFNTITLGGVITSGSSSGYTLTTVKTATDNSKSARVINLEGNASSGVKMTIGVDTALNSNGGNINVKTSGNWVITSGKTLALNSVNGNTTGTLNIEANKSVNVTAVGEKTGNAILALTGTISNSGSLNIGSGVELALNGNYSGKTISNNGTITGTMNITSITGFDTVTTSRMDVSGTVTTSGNGFSQKTATIFSGTGSLADSAVVQYNGTDITSSLQNGTYSYWDKSTYYITGTNNTLNIQDLLRVDGVTSSVAIQNNATDNNTTFVSSSNADIGTITSEKSLTFNVTDGTLTVGGHSNNGILITKTGSGTLKYTTASAIPSGGAILEIRGGNVELSTGGGTARIKGAISVFGGAALTLSASDALGYDGEQTPSITLAGSAPVEGSEPAKYAILDLGTTEQTMQTALNLNGYAKITGSTGGAFNSWSNDPNSFSKITVKGDHNEITCGVLVRQGLEVSVSENSSLEISGTVRPKASGQSNAGFKKTGLGLLTIIGSTSMDKQLQVEAGTMKISGATNSLSGAVTVSTGATLEFARGTTTISDVVSGGGVIKVSGGTVTLNGNNTYTNETRLSGGEIQAGNANAFGTGKLIVDGDSSISGTATIADFIDVSNKATLTIKGGSAITLSNSTANKGMWIASGSSVALESGASITGYNVTVSYLNANSELAAEGADGGQFGTCGHNHENAITIKESAISLANGAVLRNKLDGGTVSSTGNTKIGWLENNSTYGGGSISSLEVTSGTLDVASDLAVTKSATIAGTLSIGEKATTAINSEREDGTASTIATITGSGTLKATGGTTEVTNASGFSGTLAATGGNIELQTAADLTLNEVVVSGGSSISGATSYTADKVSIGEEGGSLVGSLSINTNGTITLDASAGTTGTGLSLSTPSTTFADEGSTSTTGSLTLGSDLTLNLLNLDLKRGQSLTLFSGVTGVTGIDDMVALKSGSLEANTVFTNLTAGDFNLSFDETNHIVALVAQRNVPEPTTATLSLLALMGLAARRRRRKA